MKLKTFKEFSESRNNKLKENKEDIKAQAKRDYEDIYKEHKKLIDNLKNR